MIYEIFICALIITITGAAISLDVPNKCPQPTKKHEVPHLFWYVHPEDCTYFFVCSHGKPYMHRCPEGTRWSDVYKTCAITHSFFDTCTRNRAKEECVSGVAGRRGLIPHPTACQRYYNCSDTGPRPMRSQLEEFEMECAYPQLFDVAELRCKPFHNTLCGFNRKAAKDACEYYNNICGSAHCQPCEQTYPSCVGRKNGMQAHPEKPWTPYYIECDSERLVDQGECVTHEPTGTRGFFSPMKNECVSRWEVPRSEGDGLAPDCTGRQPGQYRTVERADIYFTCPGAEVSYCGRGSAFNEASRSCVEVSN